MTAISASAYSAQMVSIYINGTFTSRADLADSMLRQLTSDEFVRKNVAVATFSQKPNVIQLLLRDASSKKAAPESAVDEVKEGFGLDPQR